VILRQQTPNCSDFDMTLADDDAPAFRLLLPEHVGGVKTRYVHTVPGSWSTGKNRATGCFCLDGRVTLDVDIHCTDDVACMTMAITNDTGEPMTDVDANVCASVNHLPSESDPDWSNRRYIPDEVPLDRYQQGDYWYERHTPSRLFALTNTGWIGMHPSPENPVDPDRPRFAFEPSLQPSARACAVESLDGSEWFYQAWDAPCHFCTPCSGNACMHLVICLTPFLGPGDTVAVRGWAGRSVGDRAILEKRLQGCVGANKA